MLGGRDLIEGSSLSERKGFEGKVNLREKIAGGDLERFGWC